MKRLLVSSSTNMIYLANGKPYKDNPKLFIVQGEKEDYTDEAIRAVFEWFMMNHKQNEPNEGYEVKYPNCNYVLTMTKIKE